MAIVKPDNGKVIFNDRGNTLEIIIPSKKKIFESIFMSLWLIGWLIGEIFGITMFQAGADGAGLTFMLVWLVLWTLGGLQVISIVVWNLAGQEIITICGDRLTIAYKALGVGPSKEYMMTEAKNFRIHLEDTGMFSRRKFQFWGLGGGMIHFDYGMKTIKFAQGAEEVEATVILNKLQERSAMLNR